MVLPIIGDRLVERRTLLVGDILGASGPDRLILALKLHLKVDLLDLRLLLLLNLLDLGLVFLTTQVGITGCGLHLEDTTIDGQHGDIESSTTQVEDQNITLLVVTNLVKIVHVLDSGSGRLVDNTPNLQTSNGTSILGDLKLRVVEVGRHGVELGRHGDDGLANSLAKVALGGLLHLNQHFGGNLLRHELLVLAYYNLTQSSVNNNLTRLSVNNIPDEVLASTLFVDKRMVTFFL